MARSDELVLEQNDRVPAVVADARRAGEMAIEEIVRIARKTGNRSLSRR